MLKNKNGSTLVMVVLIFAVLSIFSAVTLSFMQTENKQSLNYEFKTQAYFAALSGAETVEEALVRQLNSYGGNAKLQKAFLEVYNSPGKIINVNIPGVNQVRVVYTDINNQKVLSIESEGEVRDVKEVINKVLYSVESIVTSTNNGQLVLPDGQFLVFLNDAKQHYQSTSNQIPTNYAIKATPEQVAMFIAHPLPIITDWTQTHSSIQLRTGYPNSYETVPGSYGSTDQVTNIYVDGDLNLKGTLNFLGEVNIFVKGSMYISNSADIQGTKTTTGEQGKNKLNIYIYNEGGNEFAVKTDNSVSFNIVSDFYISSNSKVDFHMHQNARIDGNIIYNGSGELFFSVDSNNFGPKYLTGSIYAPFATVRLGYRDDKIAFIFGGKVIGNNIHVYANNKIQAVKFYDSSNDGSSTIIPVNVTENVTTRSISYKSYFND